MIIERLSIDESDAEVFNIAREGTMVPATFVVEIGVRVCARCVVPSKMTSALSGLRARSLW